MIALGEIVDQYIGETGDTSRANFARFYQFAVRGLREINMDVEFKAKTILFDIDPNTMTAQLPKGYIDYLRIGIVIGNQIVPFGINEDLAFNRKLNNCGGIADYPNWPLNEVGDYVWGTVYGGGVLPPHTINGEDIGAFFGQGGGFRLGYYRIDKEHGLIQFGETVAIHDIYMEYLVDVQAEKDGKILVNEFDAEAVLAYIAWRHAINNKSFTLGEKQMRQNEWYNQKRLAKKRHRRLNTAELLQMIHKSFKLSPHI